MFEPILAKEYIRQIRMASQKGIQIRNISTQGKKKKEVFPIRFIRFLAPQLSSDKLVFQAQ